MDSLKHKLDNRKRRKLRVRRVISGSQDRPRMSVFISNHNITAQLIDDNSGKTLVYSTTVGRKDLGSNMTERAKWVGLDIAKKAKAKKYTAVVFDRGGKIYHGRVASVADAAREAGLEI